MRPRSRFLISTGATFLLVLSLLLWLGPVWIYDLEERLIPAIASFVVLLVILALLGCDPAGNLIVDGAIMAHEAASFGGRLLRNLPRRFSIAFFGILAGTLLAFLLAWGISRLESSRLAYARIRPDPALTSDFLLVVPVIDAHRKAHKKPPPDLPALLQELRAAGVRLRFSKLTATSWMDAWGHPIHYRAKRGLTGWKIELYSLGPNGLDDRGKPDDIVAEALFDRWKLLKDFVKVALSE